MRKILLTMLIGLFLLGIVSGENSGGDLIGKQDGCIQLPQECASCSFVNITSVQFPDLSRSFINSAMTKQGTSFNYTFCNTTQLGSYTYCVVGDVDGTDTVACKDFEITPSGSLLSQASSLTLFGSLAVMIILSLVFLYIATKTENLAGKVALYAFSGICFIMVILYTVVTIQQALYGFDSILTGIETFWFVMKVGVWIGFVALGIIILLIMLKAWKIKRGLYD